MTNRGKIVLAGGSGFLGNLLAKWFSEQGLETVICTRSKAHSKHARMVSWDGQTIGSWHKELDGALALVNLAGRSVDCRYNARNRKVMVDSRILSTRVLGEAIGQCADPPKVWLNASTATIYEHTYGAPHSESGRIAGNAEAKDEFSVDLARAWEEEFNRALCPSTRKILLRIAMVFDGNGSVYKVLRRLIRAGLGGKMGHGKQFVSWIHSRDFCRAVERLIRDEKANGVYNLSSPNPIPNSEMMANIRRSLGVPFGLPATKWMLEVGAFFLRTETELTIKSRNVVPTRLASEGFSFDYPDFYDAICSFRK